MLLNNMGMEISRLQSTEKRLKDNSSLGQDYSDTIERYLSEGYVRKVDKSDLGEDSKWFLPHFLFLVRPDKDDNQNSCGIRSICYTYIPG